MRKRSRLRRELKWRWAIWSIYMAVWPVLMWGSPLNLWLFLFFAFMMVAGGFLFFMFVGPGMILARIWEIRDRKERRRFEELNARFSKVEPDDPPYYELDADDYEEIEKELKERENDMVSAYRATESGKSGRSVWVVPSDVRPWFPPYIDGFDLVVHEDSYGLSGQTITDYELLDEPFDLSDTCSEYDDRDEDWDEDEDYYI